jgi:hypothetical protein
MAPSRSTQPRSCPHNCCSVNHRHRTRHNHICQLPGWSGHCGHGDLRHHAVHHVRHQDRGHGTGLLHGITAGTGRHCGQALHVATCPTHDTSAIGRCTWSGHGHADTGGRDPEDEARADPDLRTTQQQRPNI